MLRLACAARWLRANSTREITGLEPFLFVGSVIKQKLFVFNKDVLLFAGLTKQVDVSHYSL
jgi:hypothetical protein